MIPLDCIGCRANHVQAEKAQDAEIIRLQAKVERLEAALTKVLHTPCMLRKDEAGEQFWCYPLHALQHPVITAGLALEGEAHKEIDACLESLKNTTTCTQK
jgi:hypothetical protein